MPVRIYDIAKKLGIESKEVLAKAKELGIAGARVASSSLDKITAEYLEQQFPPKPKAPPAPPPAPPTPVPAETPAPAASPVAPAPAAPEVAAPPAVPAAPPSPVTAPEPVVIAPAVPEVKPEPVVAEAKAPMPAAEPQAPPKIEVIAPPLAPPVEEPTAKLTPPPPPAPVAPPSPPPPPPPPPKPELGSLVGRIQLPPRPSRFGDKSSTGKVQQRSGPPTTRTETNRPARPENRPAPKPPGQQGRPQPGPAAPTRAPEPATAKDEFVPPATGEVITLKPPFSIRDLADQLKRKPHQIIADLVSMNVWATVNQSIDESVAQRLCAKYGFRFEAEKRKGGGGIHVQEKKVELDVEDKLEDMKPRAPVVTIMGHVDHGKTTLLDVIRKSDVAAGEAGGITQHIGAYTISFPHPERKGELQQITFLDTPGHAAFSAMRARGANVTDIVVLVVAANDGVMPQTIEAMNHAKAAKVPILVAVNKIDHPNAQALRVRQQLQGHGLVPDDWGGDTIFVDVSALTKQGVDKLLEMLLLQADLLELKANPNRRAKGNVVESGLSPGGPTATVLVRKGTLHVGDAVICGSYWGRVRALINEEGKRLKEAGPSIAVKLLGLNGVPDAGLEFSALENEKAARELAGTRADQARKEAAEGGRGPKVTLEEILKKLDPSGKKVLKLVIKADMQGSVEAIVEALKKIESNKVSLEIIHSAVGTITEADVKLASAAEAVIFGFHTRIDVGVSDLAKREGVQIKLYEIIYELIDEVKLAMAGLLEPIIKENVIGVAEVRKIFELSKGGKVAGCVVNNGRIVRGKVRVLRRKGLIYEGSLSTLRRFQDEVNEVRAGMECGMRLDGFDDFQPGDTIESFLIERLTPSL